MKLRYFTFSLFSLLTACGDGGSPQKDPVPTANTTTAASSGDTKPATAQTSAPAKTAEATVSSTAEPASSASASAEPTKTGDAVAQKSAAPTATATATVTATAVASAPDVKGEEKKQAAFSAYLSGAGKYAAGSPGNVTAVLNALGEYHVNQDYPIKFTLGAAPAGVSFGETVLRNATKGDKRASISIPFTPSAAGSYTISGVFSIGVCVASSCTNEKVPLSVTVKVE